MGRSKMLVLVLAGVALGVNGVASALAQQFHFSKLGKILGTNTVNHALTLSSGGPEVMCTKVMISGQVAAKLTLQVLLDYEYSQCTELGFAAVVSLMRVIKNADNKLLILENTVKIEIPIAGCSITIPSQHLIGVTYINTNKKIEERTNINSIKSIGTGGACGTGGNSGTYTGNSLLELEGGTLEWF